jgi:hypothetical protein
MISARAVKSVANPTSASVYATAIHVIDVSALNSMPMVYRAVAVIEPSKKERNKPIHKL